jgi:hypothetical protein
MSRRALSALLAFPITFTVLASLAACSPAGIDDTQRSYAAFEGSWQCHAQRFAYPDLDTLQTRLDQRLVDTGLTRDGYDEFVDELENSSELRGLVEDTYVTACPGNAYGVSGSPIE